MQFGLDVPIDRAYADPTLLSDLAYDAERAGWDGFFVQDVFAGRDPVIDPWIGLAAVALRTERVRIGVFLTPLARRQPWEVARQATTIDHLSGGRLIAGAALGHSEADFTPFGLPWDARLRAERLEESLDVITGLWSGEPYSHLGTHYHLDGALLRPTPLQRPGPPVWLAAGWPRQRPLRRAARWDGVYLMTFQQDTGEPVSPDDVRAAVQVVRQTRRATSTHEPLDVAVNALSGGPGPNELVNRFEEAGATWWIEHDTDANVDSYRNRIRKGPPRPIV